MRDVVRGSVDNTLLHLAPANGTNAIVSAAFAIELDSPDSSLAAGFGALTPLMTADGFEPPQQQMLFTMNMGVFPTGSNISGGTPEIAGYTYLQKNNAGQQVRDFSLRGNTLSVVVYKYTRWASIWPEVRKLFERSNPLLAASTKTVKSVVLQYIDKFTWRQPDAPFPTKEVLRSDSKQFAPQGLELRHPWHNQFGYIRELPDHAWASNRVENVNLSIAAEAGFSTLTIFTIYRYFARSPSKAPADFVTNVLSPVFGEAHDHNKQLLREILTDDVCNKINLNG
jgi:uncharacterized protein (TIGR04255 family)